MEGITNEAYRLAIQNSFPDWGYHFTDFLRIPSSGFYTSKKIIQHFGIVFTKKNHSEIKQAIRF